jgi:hypothetical protein
MKATLIPITRRSAPTSPARVARRDRRVGLEEVDQGGGRATRRDRAVEPGDHSGGHRVLESEWIADGHRELSYHRPCVGQPRCRKAVAIDAHESKVDARVGGDQPRRRPVSARERDLDGSRTVDDVGVRHDQAVTANDHTAALALALCGLGEDRDHRGLHLADDSRDVAEDALAAGGTRLAGRLASFRAGGVAARGERADEHERDGERKKLTMEHGDLDRRWGSAGLRRWAISSDDRAADACLWAVEGQLRTGGSRLLTAALGWWPRSAGCRVSQHPNALSSTTMFPGDTHPVTRLLAPPGDGSAVSEKLQLPATTIGTTT